MIFKTCNDEANAAEALHKLERSTGMGLYATVHVFDKDLKLKEKNRVDNIEDYQLRLSFYYGTAESTYGESNTITYMWSLEDLGDIQAVLDAEQEKIESFYSVAEELSKGCWWTAVRVKAVSGAALRAGYDAKAVYELISGLEPDDLLLVCGDTWLS